MIVCSECGHQNPTGSTFCRNRDCGSYLMWSSESVPTTATPPVGDLPGPGGDRSGEVGLTVHLAERELSVAPGESTACAITIRNTGQVVDQYMVQMLGDPARWASVDPPSINLAPGAEGSASVAFHPPRRPEIHAGTKPFRLEVHSRERPAANSFADGTVTVAPFFDLATELRPQIAEGRSGRYTVAVENRGNAPVVAYTDAAAAGGALAFRISSPVMTVPPGSQGVAIVNVRPLRHRVAGGGRLPTRSGS